MNKKVMVVDDEPIIAKGISRLLTNTDYSVDVSHTVFSGRKALEICQNETLDIIITDIKMPGINGIELIKEIKKTSANTQIIILTGFGTLDYAKEAMEQGIRFFLEKPIRPEELKHALNESINRLDQKKIEGKLWIKRCFERVLTASEITECPKELCLPLNVIFFKAEYYSTLSKRVRESQLNQSLVLGYVKNAGYMLILDNWTEVKDTLELLLRKHLSKGVFFYKTITEINELHDYLITCSENFDKEYYFPQPQFLAESDFLKKVSAQNEVSFSQFQKNFFTDLDQGELDSATVQVKKFFKKCYESLYPVKLLQFQINDLLSILLKKHKLAIDSIFDDYSLKIFLLGNYEELQFLLIHAIELIGQQASIASTSDIVKSVNIIIEKYYDQESLSLKWIAKNLLFLNSEYIGKLYYKETGDRFTTKLTNFRMEKAITLLEENYKVYEVAQLTGYGDSTEYFIKNFKKFTGKTPKQYLKI
ncbi:response regulator [Enterococcus sp. JM9B]|uniref:response regulator n=1 Tax=Enterococcus sp. JM9B TaxID=1857216 RepID=UPI001374EB14|nr:response regulator [Enterococcus sp. JM9B]KAF1301879.1 hypothetical protein BAU16_08320 [Enterococcus sp. JM9B]